METQKSAKADYIRQDVWIIVTLSDGVRTRLGVCRASGGDMQLKQGYDSIFLFISCIGRVPGVQLIRFPRLACAFVTYESAFPVALSALPRMWRSPEVWRAMQS
jgi:hypothetical protein